MSLAFSCGGGGVGVTRAFGGLLGAELKLLTGGSGKGW